MEPGVLLHVAAGFSALSSKLLGAGGATKLVGLCLLLQHLIVQGCGLPCAEQSSLVGVGEQSGWMRAFWNPWSIRGPWACLGRGADFPGISGRGVVGCRAMGSMLLRASLCARKWDLTVELSSGTTQSLQGQE